MCTHSVLVTFSTFGAVRIADLPKWSDLRLPCLLQDELGLENSEKQWFQGYGQTGDMTSDFWQKRVKKRTSKNDLILEYRGSWGIALCDAWFWIALEVSKSGISRWAGLMRYGSLGSREFVGFRYFSKEGLFQTRFICLLIHPRCLAWLIYVFWVVCLKQWFQVWTILGSFATILLVNFSDCHISGNGLNPGIWRNDSRWTPRIQKGDISDHIKSHFSGGVS